MKKWSTIALLLAIISTSVASGCITNRQADVTGGTLVFTANPPITEPPRPGMVWALQTPDSGLYYLWDSTSTFTSDGDFVWDISVYGSFNQGQSVNVYGHKQTMYDINGMPFNVIIVDKIS